jgi:transposase
MVGRYELSDAQWQRIAQMLPGKAGDRGRTGADNRLFVNAVLWVLRSGAWWQDLPERYGKWKSVHKRFTRWAKAGVWERVFDSLAGDPDNQYLMLDTTLERDEIWLIRRKVFSRCCVSDSRLGLDMEASLLWRDHIRWICESGRYGRSRSRVCRAGQQRRGLAWPSAR